MIEYELNLRKLLDILFRIMLTNKGVKPGEGLRGLDAGSLVSKFFGHAISALYLHKGINIPDLSIPMTNVLDPSSLDVLVRAALESFLVFYYIFIESSDKNESDLKYQAWELAGFYKRQEFPAKLEENIKKLNREREAIKELEEKIKSNLIYKSYSEKKKKNFFKQLKKGFWRSKGWAEIAESAGFSKINAEVVYSFLCEHAHSGNISATQIWQSNSHSIRRNLMRPKIGHLNICTANMIKCCCSYFPRAREYYVNNYEEPNIVTLWLGIGQEL